jgi:predicted O-methyltransferase YrrM
MELSNLPWLNSEFVTKFSLWNTLDWTMFEWGAGGSTIWFAERVKKLISIEHDSAWFDSVRVVLKNRNLVNVDLFLIPKDSPEYWNSILNCGEFDCILVDGRNRVNCGRNAVKRLKVGGVLILDDAERDRYSTLIADLKSMENMKYFSMIDLVDKVGTKTDYWIKEGVEDAN